MAIGVTPNYQFFEFNNPGAPLRYARLDITGLAAGNNVVAHGLPAKPLIVGIEPTSNNNFWEYQPCDAANIYLGAGTGGGTTLSIYLTY
jgi:hypothetical protein